MNQKLCCLTLVNILLSSSLYAQRAKPGILGMKAPKWSVDQWINLKGQKDKIDISDFKGKVIYLYCFQSWCPGCHKYGFPTLQKMVDKYGKDDKVALVAVQTVFEGASFNTPDKAWQTAKKYGLKIPIGHAGKEGKYPALMKNYRTGGTPWVVIIDRQGRVRFNDYHVDPKGAIKFLAQLKEEKGKE
tara:strand:- start:372 stop:932 length:561 start_codon:yes stop_codon:yes gene_type:complete